MKNNWINIAGWVLIIGCMAWVISGSKETTELLKYNQAKLDSIQAGQDLADSNRARLQPVIIEVNQKHNENKSELREREIFIADSICGSFKDLQRANRNH